MYDGGHTFTKPNYPNNQVISAPSRFTDPNQGSEGDQHVIKVGSYFYMYFVAAWNSFKIDLAQLAGNRRRETRHMGGSTTTAHSPNRDLIGGESSVSSIRECVGESMGVCTTPPWEHTWALSLVNPKGLGYQPRAMGWNNWTQVSGTLLTTDHTFWGRGPESGELIEYMSLIELDHGNPDVQGQICGYTT